MVTTRHFEGSGIHIANEPNRETEKTMRHRLFTAGTLIFLTASLLSSCVSSPPTLEELANADFGTPISQEDGEQLAKNFISSRLKDPLSAQYQWERVEKGWVRQAPIYGGRIIYGYQLKVQVNAKNGYGGYVGFRPFHFIFYNGKIKTVFGQRDLDGTPYMGKIY